MREKKDGNVRNTNDTSHELEERDQTSCLRDHLGLIVVGSLDGNDDILQSSAETSTEENLLRA